MKVNEMSTQTEPITQIKPTNDIRIHTGLSGFDELVGGGLKVKSCILFAGQPGVGKSTLWLQVSGLLAKKGYPVLYITGEEDLSQLRERADRLNTVDDNLIVSNSTILEEITDIIDKKMPKLLIIDSLQTISSNEKKARRGTPTQLDYCLSTLINKVKQGEMIFITIGHSTKNGVIAGMLRLQHDVDVTMFMTNEYDDVRCLRVIKNRYGRSNIGWLLQMTAGGFVDAGRNIFNLDEGIRAEKTSNVGVLIAPLYAVVWVLAFLVFMPFALPYYLLIKRK